jgi:hypothetical protein
MTVRKFCDENDTPEITHMCEGDLGDFLPEEECEINPEFINLLKSLMEVLRFIYVVRKYCSLNDIQTNQYDPYLILMVSQIKIPFDIDKL